MADQPALNATFFALRKRETGGVLTGASIAFLICAIVLFAGFVALSWATLAPFFTWYVGVISAANDPEAMAALGFPPGLFEFIGLAFLWLFVVFVLYAAYEAACLRWLTRGETGGLFGLTLGADTWRVYLSYWVWLGIYMAGSTALSFVMMFVVFALAMGGAGGSMDGEQMGVSFILAMVVMYALYYGALAYFAVRFAPAAATSVARGRFSFFDAWVVTRGRFWSLFGSFFLIYIMQFVAGLVLGIVALFLLFGSVFAGLDMSAAATNPEAFMSAYMAALGQIFSNPTTIALFATYYIIATAIGLFFVVLMFGVNARAVQAALEEGKIKPAAATA
jgi:hypothetical protein